MKNFENRISTSNIMFRYAKGVSSQVGKEFHPYHEIVLFMGENAVLYSDTQQMQIKPGTLIVIPKETYHQLNIKGDRESYIRCVLNFGDIPETKEFIKKNMKRIYVSEVSKEIGFLFETLIKTAVGDYSDSEKGIILKSVLTLILSNLSVAEEIKNGSKISEITKKSIQYIKENISVHFRTKDMAKFLNVSESLLYHTFKEEMNISVHKYILKKRLTIAYEKIKNGTPATIASYECGFSEYSNFYRQYKKAFGFSPSHRELNIKKT